MENKIKQITKDDLKARLNYFKNLFEKVKSPVRENDTFLRGYLSALFDSGIIKGVGSFVELEHELKKEEVLL